MPPSASEVDKLKHAPQVDGVLPVILERWSPRAFSDKAVDPADLKKIFEAARWAPSSFNEQPWRFLVGAKGSETYEKIGSVLAPFNQQWALYAPVLILGVAKPAFSHNNTPNICAAHDLGAASGFITLEAASLGLTTHQMAGFDHEKAKEVFGVPKDWIVGSVTALGYLGEPSNLTNEQMLRQEVAPRTRKPLSEIVLASFDKAADLD